MKKDEGGFDELVRVLQRIWRYRKGHEPVGRLQDALEALPLATPRGLRPVLAHEHKTETGWHLVLHLPPGISVRDVISKSDHFKEQTGGEIDYRLIGQNLHLDVSLQPLGTNVPYERNAGGYPDMHLPVPLGVTRQGPLVVDLTAGPHMLAGGNTGNGKTTFLRGLVVSLLLAGAEVVIVDLKGGLDFACFRAHAKVVTTNEDALKVMQALHKECQRRLPILEAACVTSLREYKGKDLPWIVLIIDEVAEMESKEAQLALNRLARLSRSAGVCIVCATQRPSANIFSTATFSNTRMLLAMRLCFAVPKAEDSKMVLDDDAAARLPPEIKGRAIWQWDRQREVQCYNLTLKGAMEILETIKPREVSLFERPRKVLPARPPGAHVPGRARGA